MKIDAAWETVHNGVQGPRHIVLAALAVSSGASAEPSASPSSGFVEARGAWIHPVTGYSGAGEGFSTSARAGFYPSASTPLAIAADVGISCAQRLSCWEHGAIGLRYAHSANSQIAIMVDGFVGLETVGLHVGKELYGYVGTASVAVVYRDGALDVGPQVGVTYSDVPSYDADIGPNPSGTMMSVGVVVDYRW